MLAEKKAEEKEITSNDYKCKLVDYKWKKSSTLMNHMKLKHGEHKCKICSKEFKISMELVSNVAYAHHKDEEVWNVNFQSTPKSKKEN